MQASQQRQPEENAANDDLLTWVLGFVVFFVLQLIVVEIVKSVTGPRGDLITNVLWWTPATVGLPGYMMWLFIRHCSSFKLAQWTLVVVLGIGVIPLVGFFVYAATFSYVADMALPLDEHRVTVTRVYKWTGTKSPSEWRLVDDRGREFSFPAQHNPRLKPGPTTIRVTRLRNIVIYAESASP